jgi:hypothetical protein
MSSDDHALIRLMLAAYWADTMQRPDAVMVPWREKMRKLALFLKRHLDTSVRPAMSDQGYAPSTGEWSVLCLSDLYGTLNFFSACAYRIKECNMTVLMFYV